MSKKVGPKHHSPTGLPKVNIGTKISPECNQRLTKAVNRSGMGKTKYVETALLEKMERDDENT